ncbi:MAG: type IV pilus assembly protein PilM [Halieaceae bacterium]|nr:type IV pilus assembly protein PilM [Halieaceae bacterium]
MTNSVIFDKATIVNSYRTVKNFFATSATGLLGVDINNYSVKVIELVRDKRAGVYQVTRFGYASVSQGGMLDNSIEGVQKLAAAVSEAVSLSGSKLKHAAAAVFGNSVINKVVDVPSGLNDDELEMFLSINSDKYIPFPLNEVAMDFQKLNLPSAIKSCEKILLTACRRDAIDKQVEAINLANLSVEVVDVAPFAAERALRNCVRNFNAENENLRLIVDVEDNYIVCNLIDSEGALFVWEEAIKCSSIQQGVSGLNQPSEIDSISESFLIQCRDNIKKSSRGVFIQALTAALKRALQMASSSTNYEIKNLVLIGDAIPTVNEVTIIGDHLDVKVNLGNPFQNMIFDPSLNSSQLTLRASSFTTACGLALRGLI